MPDISRFRGLSYDPSRVELSQVITPPYDVIDAAQRGVLANRNPHNFVRIDLPEPEDGNDRYRVAADTLAAWQANGILHRDAAPALYRYHQEFTDREQGRVVTRKGI